MADRQTFDSGQKRTPLQGISLANFGGNLNFGPTLVPASESPSISSRPQPIAAPASSGGKYNLEDAMKGRHLLSLCELLVLCKAY